MTVSKEIKRLENSAVNLTITVKKDEVRSEYDKVLADYSKSIQLPGFRKGKAPRDVLERKFGNSLKEEVLARLLENATRTVFEDESFPQEDQPLPHSTPHVEGKPVLDFESDLTFSVVYEVFPKVVLGNWKSLEVEIPDVIISDDDVKRELEAIQERNAFVMDKDDSSLAEKGDVVTVNYCELDENGGVIADTEREGFAFTLGSGYNLFKFDDDILGMKKGETKDIEKTYPETFEYADIAGKTKKLRITLAALKAKKLPDLDDEFAQDVDEKYNTLDDLKKAIRERLTNDVEGKLKRFKIDGLLEKIRATTPVDLPKSLVDSQIDNRMRNISQRTNMPLETVMNMVLDSSHESTALIDKWRAEAAEGLHDSLIVTTLIRELNITVSEEEVENDYEAIAKSSESTLDEIKSHYVTEEAQGFHKEFIKERKLFDLLIAENTFIKGSQESYPEFIKRTEKQNG